MRKRRRGVIFDIAELFQALGVLYRPRINLGQGFHPLPMGGGGGRPRKNLQTPHDAHRAARPKITPAMLTAWRKARIAELKARAA